MQGNTEWATLCNKLSLHPSTASCNSDSNQRFVQCHEIANRLHLQIYDKQDCMLIWYYIVWLTDTETF